MISLAKPSLPADAHEALERVLKSGRLVRGPEARAFEREILDRIPAHDAISCSSGTMALWALLSALDLPAGALVGVPGFTFAGVAHAVIHAGGVPVPIDVEETSLGMDPNDLEQQAQGQSLWGAIVVDPFGISLDFRPFDAICAKHEMILIEDAACAIRCTSPNGDEAGTRGRGAILSFHPRKPVTTGEGGMILTQDPKLAKKLRLLIDHGYDPDQGTYVMPGFNGRLSELAAALGRCSLAVLDEEIAGRMRAIEAYERLAAECGLDQQLRLIVPSSPATWNGQTLVGVLKNKTIDVELLRDHMRACEIEVGRTAQWWPGLPAFREQWGEFCPVGREMAESTVALPLYGGLSNEEILHIVTSIKSVLARQARPGTDEGESSMNTRKPGKL
jgi:dTDP-4-amino-4,6-dideoxygalactose transaminase